MMKDPKTTPPRNFVHLFQDPSFLRATFFSTHHQILEGGACKGVRYSYGPFAIEYYTGDDEPQLPPLRGLRLVVWHRVLRDTVPASWKVFPFESNRMVYAYLDIRDMESLSSHWKKTFRNYNNLLLKDNAYEIKEIPYPLYLRYYKLYAPENISKLALDMSIATQEKYALFLVDRMMFLVLVHKTSQEIVAGVSVADSPVTRQSYYVSAFTRKDVAPPFAGFFLCKRWMEASSKKGMMFANLGAVWTQGQPESWKGFSNFKMKFNPHFLVLKRELFRITFSLR